MSIADDGDETRDLPEEFQAEFKKRDEALKRKAKELELREK